MLASALRLRTLCARTDLIVQTYTNFLRNAAKSPASGDAPRAATHLAGLFHRTATRSSISRWRQVGGDRRSMRAWQRRAPLSHKPELPAPCAPSFRPAAQFRPAAGVLSWLVQAPGARKHSACRDFDNPVWPTLIFSFGPPPWVSQSGCSGPIMRHSMRVGWCPSGARSTRGGSGRGRRPSTPRGWHAEPASGKYTKSFSRYLELVAAIPNRRASRRVLQPQEQQHTLGQCSAPAETNEALRLDLAGFSAASRFPRESATLRTGPMGLRVLHLWL
jgi:hypothetical protein